jgi:ligand-binding sensor domain-containing protein
MNLYKIFIPFTLLVLLISLQITAQVTNKFEHISIEAGLSSETIYQILQDKYGFIWIATQDGLDKYDGYSFKNYQNNPDGNNTISNNYVYSICEVNDNLWIATHGGGLNKFDGTKFTHFNNSQNNPNSLISNKTQKVYSDHSGTLWIGTNIGLDKFNQKENTFTHYLKNVNVLNIAEDKDDNLYIKAEDGIYTLNKTRNEEHKFLPPNYLIDVFGTALFVDHLGVVWVATQKGIFTFDLKTGHFYPIKQYKTIFEKIAGINFFCIYEDRDYNLWFGTRRFGLYKYDRQKKSFTQFLNDSNDPASLSGTSVRDIIQDRSGILWIATNIGGLNKLDLKPQKFKHYYHIPGDKKSLSADPVYSLYDDNNTIWVGGSNFLCKFNKKTNTFEDIKLPESNLIAGYWTINAIYKGPDNNLWLGTTLKGLQIYNPKTNKFISINNNSFFPQTLCNDWVRSILKGKNNDYWIAAQRGLYRYNSVTRKFILYNKSSDTNSLNNNNVNSLYEDNSGIIWIGTADGGLNRFDITNNKFTHFGFHSNGKNNLLSDDIISINGDDQYIWIGTISGLNRLDRKSFEIVGYTNENGLPNHVINDIQKDNQGNLWLSTNYGLSKLDIKSNSFRNYDQYDGLQENKFDGRTSCKTSDGEIYFGGRNGISSFYPERIENNKFIPQVYITSFSVFDKERKFDVDITKVKEIQLNYTDNILQFEFAALDYTSPIKNKYKYILEGFDSTWVYSGSKRFAKYTNLDSGTYTFKVIGSNNDGIWNNEGISVKLIIKPPYWKTTWFRIVSIFFLLLIAFALYKIKVRSIEKRRKSLENLILDKTLLNDRLQTQKSELEMYANKAQQSNSTKDKFFSIIAHDLKNPFHSIMGVTKLLMDEGGSLSEAEYANFLEKMYETARNTYSLLENLLQWSRTQTGLIEFYPETVEIKDLVERSLQLLQGSSFHKGINMKVSVESGIRVEADVNMIDTVIRNLLSNAIKFTHENCQKPDYSSGPGSLHSSP